MNTFEQFNKTLQENFKTMQEQEIFVVNIDKDELWKHYLQSYAPEDNQVLFSNPEKDCNSCKKFIKQIAGTVIIKDNQLMSIWRAEGLDPEYQRVIDSMRELVENAQIKNIFLLNPNVTSNGRVGDLPVTIKPDNTTLFRDKIGMTFTHLHTDVKAEFINSNSATILSKVESRTNVYKRALEEFRLESIELVIDLINTDLYRGEEHLEAVKGFQELKIGYNLSSNKDAYAWSTRRSKGSGIRNSVIGTLIIDINDGMDLTEAVKKFEVKVAPSNYKRTSAPVTKAMKDKAFKNIQEKGIEKSLYKRYARYDDMKIEDVLFVNRDTSDLMKSDLEKLMDKGVTKTVPKLGDVRDILTKEQFVNNILPQAESVSLLVENKHIKNMVSLIAPQHTDSPNILQWDNNFSWAYKGGVTDAMKERIKAAGGNIEGVLRFSIQWNEDRQDTSNDLDAHCVCPEGHIMYSNKMNHLDVDITSPGQNTAVENITWKTIDSIKNGTYKFYVHNYSGRNSRGFRAQVEIDGEVFEYDYSSSVTEDVVVATVIMNNGKMTIEHNLPSTSLSTKVWNITTKELVEVTTICKSPNHWEANTKKVGNEHLFFILKDCKNPENVRGLYNEFLDSSLMEDRKSFDMLGSLLTCEYSDEQMSGVGFSSTVREEITVVVRGEDVSGTYTVRL